MSDMNEPPMIAPMPTANCAQFTALLPLLSSGTLTSDEEASTRTHVSECAWCQSQLATYDIVDAGLRRHFGDGRSAFISLEEIMNGVEDDTATQPELFTALGTNFPRAPHETHVPYRPQRKFSTLAAVAAVLLLSLFAGLIFISHGRLQTAKPTASATISRTPSMSDTTPSSLTPSVGGNFAQHWAVVTTIPKLTLSLQFAPSNPRDAYLCADDGPAAAPLSTTSRLYKSSDGGQHWQLIANTPHLAPIAAPNGEIAMCTVFVDSNNANDIFFQQVEFNPGPADQAIARLLLRSQDGGATWHQLTSLDVTDGFSMLSVIGTRLVGVFHTVAFGSIGSGWGQCSSTGNSRHASQVVSSDDGGVTWHDLGQPIEDQNYSPIDAATAGNVLLAVADKVSPTSCGELGSGSGAALWRSTDGGATWVMVQTANAFMSIVNFAAKANGTGFYGLVALGSENMSLLYSSDSGQSWTTLPALTHIVQSIVAPSGAVLSNDSEFVWVLRPNASAPAWSSYAAAPEYVGSWQVVPDAGNGTLCSIYAPLPNGPVVVQHLPLP